MKKRVMDVEDVLSWTYREELPKSDAVSGGSYGPPNYVSPLARMVASGGMRVDNWSREPGFPSAMGSAHPDALLVAQAVARVAAETGEVINCLDSEIRLGDDIALLGVDEAEAMRCALATLEATIARCAKLRERPFWTSRTVPRPLRHANNHPQVVRWAPVFREDPFGNRIVSQELVPVEVVNKKKDVYPPDAYCPVRYDPEPQSIAEERAEYLAWWGALQAIATALSGRLDTIAILPPFAPQRPWIDATESAKPPRIFADLTARVYQSEQRQTAAAHRALGLRGTVSCRSAAGARGLPMRGAPAHRRGPAKAACKAG